MEFGEKRPAAWPVHSFCSESSNQRIFTAAQQANTNENRPELGHGQTWIVRQGVDDFRAKVSKVEPQRFHCPLQIAAKFLKAVCGSQLQKETQCPAQSRT